MTRDKEALGGLAPTADPKRLAVDHLCISLNRTDYSKVFDLSI